MHFKRDSALTQIKMRRPSPDEDSTLPDQALLEELDRFFPINAESRDAALKATLDALDPLDQVEMEDRSGIIRFMLAGFKEQIKVVGSSVTPQNPYPKHPDEWYESFKNPDHIRSYDGILDSLKGQYDDLPESCKTFGEKVYSWEEILEANPRVQYDFMVAGNLLNKPAPYFINEKGCMVFGDGELKESTLDRDYIESKISSMRGHGLNMITFQEFLRRTETMPTKWGDMQTWFESGPIRVRVAHGGLFEGEPHRGLTAPTRRENYRGTLRVNRIPLNFQQE